MAEEEKPPRVARKIREIQAKLGKSKYTGGIFTWPPGYEYITRLWNVYAILKVKKLHTGIDIRAPKGAEVWLPPEVQ